MKKLFNSLVILFFLSILFPTKIGAQENWKITDFHSEMLILDTGMVSVKETVDVDFGSLDKHGIFRNLPFVYQNKDGSKTYLEFNILSVKRDGASEKNSQTYSKTDLVIKIGDSDQTISGVHTYQLEYSVKGALLSYENFDELYWNVTGNSWDVPIEKSSAAVVLEKGKVLQSTCYQGTIGSNESCKLVEIDSASSLLAATRQLSPGEGLTIALGYTKGSVPMLVGQAPKTVADDLLKPVNLFVTITILLLGSILITNLWLRKGRDFWFGRNYLFGKKAEFTPVGAKETVVVEYSPPEDLRPAELAMLLDEKAETLDVTATLIDLANRGHLTISEESKKWVFGDIDYIFNRLEKDTKNMLEYEQELLLRLFDDGDSVQMSKLKNKFYKDLAVVKEKLYLNLTDKKFFVENPSKVRVRYSFFAIVLGIVGASLAFLGFGAVNSLLVEVGVAIVVLAVISLIIAQFMPARTALGRQMYVRAKGYRLFIETAEKYRQRFFEKKNIFNEVLPYAIVFGLTEKFAKAFEKMGLEPQQPSWYSSPHAFNAVAFGATMNSFSTSVGNSIASSPSSSGSGGGGFSGGGFGGGGGGSW